MAAVDTAPDVLRIRNNSGHLLNADNLQITWAGQARSRRRHTRKVNRHTAASRMSSQRFLTIIGNPNPRPMTEFVAESCKTTLSAQPSPVRRTRPEGSDHTDVHPKYFFAQKTILPSAVSVPGRFRHAEALRIPKG